MDLKDRERKIDIEKLTPEQAEAIALQLGESTRTIFDKAIAEANKLLNIYGMEAKFQAVIGPIGKVAESLTNNEAEKPQKQRKSRKKKEANL